MCCIWAAEAGNITPMRVNALPVQTPKYYKTARILPKFSAPHPHPHHLVNKLTLNEIGISAIGDEKGETITNMPDNREPKRLTKRRRKTSVEFLSSM